MSIHALTQSVFHPIQSWRNHKKAVAEEERRAEWQAQEAEREAVTAALPGEIRGGLRGDALAGKLTHVWSLDRCLGIQVPDRKLADRPKYADAVDRYGDVGRPSKDYRTADSHFWNYVPSGPSATVALAHGFKRLHPDDKAVFCDIGTGPGAIPMAVHLITGRNTMGQEYEPLHVEAGQKAVDTLGIGDHVQLRLGDARSADYSGADFFYMYWPMDGKALEDVLGQLHAVAEKKPISLVFNGPTQQLDAKPWLVPTRMSSMPGQLYQASPATVNRAETTAQAATAA